MKAAFLALAGLVGVSLFATSANAQADDTDLVPVVSSFAPGSNIGYRASTVQEGVQRGFASVVQAAGEYNYLTAKSLIAYEQARELAIENNHRALQTYFRNRELNREFRFGPRGYSDSASRYSQHTPAPKPQRPTPYELDPVFGTITWPEIFNLPMFDQTRSRMEELFRDRDLANSGIGTRNQRAIQLASETMQQQLKRLIRELNPQEYMTAKKFLGSLSYEARFTPQIQSVASR